MRAWCHNIFLCCTFTSLKLLVAYQTNWLVFNLHEEVLNGSHFLNALTPWAAEGGVGPWPLPGFWNSIFAFTFLVEKVFFCYFRSW